MRGKLATFHDFPGAPLGARTTVRRPKLLAWMVPDQSAIPNDSSALIEPLRPHGVGRKTFAILMVGARLDGYGKHASALRCGREQARRLIPSY